MLNDKNTESFPFKIGTTLLFHIALEVLVGIVWQEKNMYKD